MKMTKRDDIKVTTWINEKVISDSNWNTFAELENDTIYLVLKDTNSENQVKIKIEKLVKDENTTESENKGNNPSEGPSI